MNCNAKHTKFQPPDDEWLCPKCGSDNAHFVIEGSAEGAAEDCPGLHDHDEVICSRCDYSASGATVARALSKKTQTAPCPHCNGTGRVKTDRVAKAEGDANG